MEEECDYMSDDIINQCIVKDERPGLLHNRKLKREHNLHKKKLQLTRPLKQLESERRVEGLNTALNETNKGFKLLHKMGYKPGSGIGKSKSGPSAPINLEIKNDNFGLGLRTSVIEKQTKRETELFSSERYRSQVKQKIDSQNLKYDYYKIRRMCQQFDETYGNLEKPKSIWYWPDYAVEIESDDEDEDAIEEEPTESEISERLQEIVEYLREKYNYCMWCSTTFKDEEDLRTSCPGETRQLHDEC